MPSITGLTAAEVEARRAAGQTNQPPKSQTKTTGEIVRDNVCTYFNLVFLVLEEDDVYEGCVETLPPCRCAAVRFRGDHSRAPQYYEQLAQFLAANGLQIAGFSREITLIDNCISDDPAQYVTEIRIPVARG